MKDKEKKQMKIEEREEKRENDDKRIGRKMIREG